MNGTDRRAFLGGLAIAAGGLTSAAPAAGRDGFAAGYDVAPAETFQAVIPRKSGDGMKFTVSLDQGAIKATSGGWARDVTARTLPIATDVSLAHLYLNPGGVREMHWHNSAEWAYVLSGNCQVTVVDPAGETEVANLEAGDLWYFPKAHSHAIQTLGAVPCHAVLAFDDGLYGEHGTFGLSDWISRLDADVLDRALGMPKDAIARIPPAEVYIRQGAVITPDSPQGRATQALPRQKSHRFRLMAQAPRARSAGGSLHVASANEFPLSTAFTGIVLKLKPQAMHEPHWHANANEWLYVARGKARITLFAADKHLSTADLSPGECAYLPRGCGHTVQNIGGEDCEIIGALDSGTYREVSLSDWIAKAPRQLLANNLGLPEEAFANAGRKKSVIVA